jgi:hypothetical protein
VKRSAEVFSVANLQRNSHFCILDHKNFILAGKTVNLIDVIHPSAGLQELPSFSRRALHYPGCRAKGRLNLYPPINEG